MCIYYVKTREKTIVHFEWEFALPGVAVEEVHGASSQGHSARVALTNYKSHPHIFH